jgi:hypothetical protein
MRGDSLRDFYAKTLALTGLGALAVVGALVDSWPGAPSLAPVPTPAAGTLVLLAANPVPDPAVDEIPVRPRVISPTTRTATVLASYSGSPAPPVETRALLSTVHGDETEAGPVSSQLTPQLAVVPAVYGGGADVLLVEPAGPVPGAAPEVVAMSEDPLATAVMDDARDGIITGAFKTAGSSIVKGGAKTGASVKAGFRRLSSAFRKALPG